MNQSQPPTDPKPTYAEKTDRFKTWIQFLKTLAPFIWLTVILLVIVPLIGQIFIANAFSPKSVTKNTEKTTVVNKLIIVGTAVGSKLAVNFAVKAAAKIVGKASGAILAKVGAQIIDPVLGIGILAWDVWDYNNMVKQSRPVLRQNILDYLTEVKLSILYSPENSIMAAIEEVEGKIMAGL